MSRRAQFAIAALLLAVLTWTAAHAQQILMGGNLGGLPPPPETTCPQGARCFYFAQSGMDPPNGAGTIISPWKTIAYAETLLSTRRPGDRLLFNAGRAAEQLQQSGSLKKTPSSDQSADREALSMRGYPRRPKTQVADKVIEIHLPDDGSIVTSHGVGF